MSTLTLVTSPAKPSQSEVQTLLERLAETALAAQMKAKEATEAADKATAAFKEALEAAGKLDEDTRAVGIVHTTIYPTRRFDETLARSLMTQKLQKECSKTVLDTKLVQAKVSPEQYKAMQKTSGWTLKISVDKG